LVDLIGEVIVRRLGEEDKKEEDSTTLILISFSNTVWIK
jgi:hypothetical protein